MTMFLFLFLFLSGVELFLTCVCVCVGPEGQALAEEQIDFAKMDVKPTVWLKDVWKMNDVYYPRLFLVACQVFPRLR